MRSGLEKNHSMRSCEFRENGEWKTARDEGAFAGTKTSSVRRKNPRGGESYKRRGFMCTGNARKTAPQALQSVCS